MKKITIMLFVLLLGVGINAYALPLWDDSPISINGNSYNVVDRQGSGNYDSTTYFGYTGPDWSGYYIGTIDGNDHTQALTDIISYYLGASATVSDSEKVDVDTVSAGGSKTEGDLTVSWATGGLSGTWSTAGSEPPVNVEFYSVKGATEFALYYLDPAVQNGDWTTAHLLNNGGNQPAISHLSVTYTDASHPVPEPATMALLFTGLIGVVGFGRKRFTK